MWFLLGGVTLVVWICIEFWRRHLFRWKADGVRDGLDYHHSTHKGKVTEVKVGVTCPEGIHFSLKRQSALDNFFKQLKVSNEFESGDVEFDDLCYVMSNHHSLQTMLVSSKEFRHAVKQIFSMEFPVRANALHCRGGRLWVVLSPTTKGDEQTLKTVTRALKPHVETIKRNLEELPKFDRAYWKDPFAIKAVILLAISSGLAINGAIQLVRVGWARFPITYDAWPLFWDAVTYGVTGIAFLALVGLYWLGRSARTHLVLIELLTIGLLGAVANAYVELRDVNMEFDATPPAWVEATLLDKQTRKGRKGGRKYYFIVEDWNCDCKPVKLRVSATLYDTFPAHGSIQVLQHSGKLGYRWVEKVATAPQSAR